jgi:hypothetical protein
VADNATGMSLRDVRKLLEDKSPGERAFDVLDRLIDAVLILSPSVLGPAGFTLYTLLDPKDRLVALCKAAIKAISRSDASDYLDQARNLAAAHSLLVYTAYFDALHQRLPELTRLTDEERRRIVVGRSEPTAGTPSLSAFSRPTAPGSSTYDLGARVIAVPHPAAAEEAALSRINLYKEMSANLLTLLTTSKDRSQNGDRLRIEVMEAVPSLADDMYRAELVGLAIDFPQFLIWMVLADQGAKSALIRKVAADTQVQFELVGRAVDLGLRGLADEMAQIRRVLADLGETTVRMPSDPSLGRVAEALHRRYVNQIDQPVIDDRYQEARGPSLAYPTRADSFVPQAYRLANNTDVDSGGANQHLEREEAWADRPIANDLGPFLLRYLDSAYSVRLPLLILGNPGSGKSLLTLILAARLAYPVYTTVRVELRDADPKTDIQRQIEAQIRVDTGEDVPWARFAQALSSPPVVILDGYDELLQATGTQYADYLDQVHLFQEREAMLGRPVRVIVTSRITLIDKVIVPVGTTIVRLEEFDKLRRDMWAQVWNSRNADYFQQTGFQPFRPPTAARMVELARQPLLLQMLAIYDSAGNQLSRRSDMDQTGLYYELLTRFIDRELSKDAAEFRQLSAKDRQIRLDRELERLGVAAMGMFNRQATIIQRNELNADLRYFDAEQDRSAARARPLSQADLLLGSFFFIHESRGRDGANAADASSELAAFEFLHKTFGEFLTADFLLSQVLAQTEEVTDLASNPRREATLRRHLELLDSKWFGCLIHTPLHTQPNVLTLLKEWAGHKLAFERQPRADLLAALDKIVLAQLRTLLTASTPPALTSQERDAPYKPLPVLGHLAIYSLNLVVLRGYLSDGAYVLDEADLGEQPIGCRAWDRLAAIWRSWFSGESLAALASRITATRHDSLITIEASESALIGPTGTSMAAAYNASLALADDLTAASLGLHLTSLFSTRAGNLEELRRRTKSEAGEMLPLLDLAQYRRARSPSIQLQRFTAETGIRADGEDPLSAAEFSYLSPGCLLDFAEIADRVFLSPGQRTPIALEQALIYDLKNLSRYSAELAIHLFDTWQPRWLPRIINAISPLDWRELLIGPSGAPILRTVLHSLSPAGYFGIAGDIGSGLEEHGDALFDVDTAAAALAIAHRGEHYDFAVWLLDTIMRARELGKWRLLDIPASLWGELADLFVISQSQGNARGEKFAELRERFAELRERFAELIDSELRTETATGQRQVDSIPDGEFLINVLRIGGAERFDYLMHATNVKLFGDPAHPAVSRRGFLLLIRWARENNDYELIRGLFSAAEVRPEKFHLPYRAWREILGVPPRQTYKDLEDLEDLEDLDVEAISMRITYREAMDLRWALDVIRATARE